jgi:hypothetical protein
MKGYYEDMSKDAIEKAYEEFGRALHHAQDIDAHTPYTESFLGVKYHKSPALKSKLGLPVSGELWDNDYVDGPGFRPERLKATEARTRRIIQEFLRESAKDGN